MPGTVWKKAFKVALEQYGFITTQDFKNIDSDPVLLRQWCQRGLVERVGYGIYRFPEVPETPLDPLMLATLWPTSRGVLSHDTALEVYELCDVNPDKIHISIPTSYRLRRKGGDLYIFHRNDLKESDMTWFEGIRIVKPIIAIKQAIKSNVPIHLIRQAITKLDHKVSVPNKSLNSLIEALESAS